MKAHVTDDQNQQLILALKPRSRKIIFIACIGICLIPAVNPAFALLLGLIVAQFTGHPYVKLNHKATHLLLQYAVVGLGFGINIHTALQIGKTGFLFTICSISGTLILGYFIGKWLKIEKKTSYLIASGTAICGGSAIAAISPVIQAKEHHISAALGCVFILNSIALFTFPLLGHYFNLSQTQFGLWCAIAIHDTSSVVGAASKFGTQALEVATTVKLGRALWIVPVSFISTFLFKNPAKKINIPYFIFFFILAMFIHTYLSFIALLNPYILLLAKSSLTLTLFLIGAGLSRATLLAVGLKPLLQGVSLWILVCAFSLYAIIQYV